MNYPKLLGVRDDYTRWGVVPRWPKRRIFTVLSPGKQLDLLLKEPILSSQGCFNPPKTSEPGRMLLGELHWSNDIFVKDGLEEKSSRFRVDGTCMLRPKQKPLSLIWIAECS